MGAHRLRLHSRRRKILLGTAWSLVPVWLGMLWCAFWVPRWWPWPAGCLGVILLLMRLGRGWPILARWIFLWEMDQVGRHGKPVRLLAWFPRIPPEPHKDTLGPDTTQK